MSRTLPKRLQHEPLIDAVFEFRFSTKASATDVIPGYLFGQLEGSKSIERLPTAELPKPLRDNDPNLQYSPLVRIHWNQFVIAVGDRVLALSCKLPYPGWQQFKPAILAVIELIQKVDVVSAVQRFSMKYVDLIPARSLSDQISMTRLTISLGEHQLAKENLSLRVEFPENDTINILSIVTSATAQLMDGTKRVGVIVDVDTIRNTGSREMNDWVRDLSDSLEDLHSSNKDMFFECLQPDTIESLGPIYE